MVRFLAIKTNYDNRQSLPPHLMTSAVNNGEKHLVDFIRQPDGKSLRILE